MVTIPRFPTKSQSGALKVFALLAVSRAIGWLGQAKASQVKKVFTTHGWSFHPSFPRTWPLSLYVSRSLASQVSKGQRGGNATGARSWEEAEVLYARALGVLPPDFQLSPRRMPPPSCRLKHPLVTIHTKE